MNRKINEEPVVIEDEKTDKKIEPFGIKKPKKPLKADLILEFLNKNKNKPFLMTDICHKLGLTTNGASCEALRQLVMNKKVKVLKLPCRCKMYYVGKVKI